jgi:hypothetical protein
VGDGSVVDQDVDGAEGGQALGGQPARPVEGGEIDRKDHRIVFELGRHRLQSGLVTGGERHPGTGAVKSPGDGGADSPGSPSDDRSASVKLKWSHAAQEAPADTNSSSSSESTGTWRGGHSDTMAMMKAKPARAMVGMVK